MSTRAGLPRCASVFVRVLRSAPRQASWSSLVGCSDQLQRTSPVRRRLVSRIASFEAQMSFTCVAARALAKPPYR